MIKIAQITDTHITPAGELLRGIDVRKRFLDVLNQVQQYNPDYIIITGDIVADNNDIAAYRWVEKELNSLNGEKIYIAGNHDNIDLLGKVFNLNNKIKNGELYFEKDIEAFKCIFLDSSKNYLSDGQLKYMEKLSGVSEKDIILFVHHPLDYCECNFMDTKYPLQNIDILKPILKKTTKIKYIFSGHYHTGKTVNIYHIKQHLCPPTSFQIFQKPVKYAMDPLNYGWRKIELENGNLVTETVNAAKKTYRVKPQIKINS